MTKILIIDDNVNLSLSLANQLREEKYLANYYDGDFSLIDEKVVNKYDLFLLDLILPETTGMEICKKIRSIDCKKPIIVFSTISDPISKSILLDLGSDDYISKPFSYRELKSRIKSVLRRGENPIKIGYKSGNIFYDSENKVVTVSDEIIKLSCTETLILEVLIKNLNNIVSYEKIMNHIYADSDNNFQQNTLCTHIKNLRNKIGKDSIKNHKGMGYVMK